MNGSNGDEVYSLLERERERIELKNLYPENL